MRMKIQQYNFGPGTLVEDFSYFLYLLVYLYMCQKPVWVARKQCRYLCPRSQREYQFLSKENRKCSHSSKWKSSGSKSVFHFRNEKDLSKFFQILWWHYSDISKHSINCPLVIILDIVNIQPIVTGRQIRHHRAAKWLTCSGLTWTDGFALSKVRICIVISDRSWITFVAEVFHVLFNCLIVLCVRSCQYALAFYVIWKLDSEKEKRSVTHLVIGVGAVMSYSFLKHKMQLPTFTFNLCLYCPLCQTCPYFLLSFLPGL